MHTARLLIELGCHLFEQLWLAECHVLDDLFEDHGVDRYQNHEFKRVQIFEVPIAQFAGEAKVIFDLEKCVQYALTLVVL